jgi:protein phosphatase 1 regulatory subunit 7
VINSRSLKTVIRKLCCVTLLTIPVIGHADFSVITDPALKKCVTKLAQKKHWDTIAEVTSIKCHNANITSIEGLQQFTSLTSLSLYKNQLRGITIPWLPQLKHLNLSGNQLSNLHLKNLPSLTNFFVFKNKLQTLKLEGTPKLVKLKANNNQLTNLTLEGSSALKKLYIFDNELEEIDMKSIPSLSYFDARHNPMSDEFYDYLDTLNSVTVLHDGNTEDWQ